MTDWKSALLSVVSDVENFYDDRKFRLQQRLGLGQLMILPYLGHGTPEKLYLRGRVLEDRHISSAMDNDSIWVNLLNMYKRYQSHEIPGATVRATLGDIRAEATADREGFFEFWLNAESISPPEDGWYEIDLELVDYPGKAENPAEPQVNATGKVIVPPLTANFGVISDIDDTVMRTDVLNLMAMARNTFLMNARTRLPFEGVAAFYQALRRGDGEGYNPIYYVSSSAWNLYDMLVDFFVVRGIPLGPMFLTDWGITPEQIVMPSHHDHKLNAIQTVLDTHPDLPFILIGDSGQQDPEIYSEVVEHNPGRILAVYIRDVSAETRDAEIFKLAETASARGVEMMAVADTVAAAVHASAHGWIDPAALPAITEDTLEDKQAPTPLEEAVMPGLQADTPRSAQTAEGAPDQDELADTQPG